MSTMQNGSLKNIQQREQRPFVESFEKIPLLTAATTFIGFYLILLMGYVSSIIFTPKVAQERNRKGYVPLYDQFESFYSRYVYRRLKDCWNIPICSCPGSEVTVKDRVTHDCGWTFEYTGTRTTCLNLGSYNYLGFAQASGPCSDAAAVKIKELGCATASPRVEFGTQKIHQEIEALTAEFVGTEDAITFGMGFATNALNLPSIMSKGCLVASDEKNHASLILGLRLSGATIRVFKHNNMESLRKLLHNAVVYGQPRSHRPWKKIFIVVEGVYSMEGSIVRLPEIVQLKREYKAYLYVDEAHSIGAVGPNGRGVIDYFGVDPKDVDILMGTYTKSFGSAGGYIAGTKAFINHLRANSHANCYATSMPSACAEQIISSMKIIMGKDGTNEGRKRIQQLAHNSQYFRRKLNQMGIITIGNNDSPVVPMMVYMHSKIANVVRRLIKRDIAVVGVGFPATPLMEGRIRFCLSAAHTKEQLDYALTHIEEAADYLGLRYSRKPRSKEIVTYEEVGKEE
ncbi:serine palmitoyltransferase 2 isoform X2 [Neocloeon triangulifer]|uniref:serine palmitoyltransferase 2 isoform X2 n=1 Tax=Neocloeon triangulifer TaxID=2078957 RepID=UPI00286F72AB|nr:serine palmitoyltransferase 2 isoform X2 [Neocloeon triangulifer]